MMRVQFATTAVASAFLLVAAPCFADHNSKNGEGWANMPNDIHNTRVETREADEQKGKANAAKNQGDAKAMNQNKVKTATKTQDKSRVETRVRDRSATPATSRSARSSMSTRNSGARGGGRKR